MDVLRPEHNYMEVFIMGMVVRSNIMAINANRSLGTNNSQVSKSLEKLSSGFKINRAGDDAAGLAISEKMKAQIKGLEQASANSQDGISLVQTAEGALTEVHSMLNRMVELATKSANGTIQDKVDREAIQSEIDALITEVDRIGDSTNFNGINLLDGSLGGGGATGANGITLSGNALDALAETTAAAGVYATNDLAASLDGLATGDKLSYTYTYEVGGKSKTTTIEFTFTEGATDKKGTLTAADGTVYDAGADGSGNHAKALKAQLQDALVDQLSKNKDIKANFTVAEATDAIQLTAKEKGSAGAVLTGVTGVWNDGGTEKAITSGVGALKTTAPADVHKKIDVTGMTVYDGTNADDAIFTVNGKKFAFVTDADAATKLDSNVSYVIAGDAADAAEGASMATLINQKTGLGTEMSTNDLVFKVSDEEAVAGAGLTLQVGDTGDAFNMVTVSVDDMRSASLGIKGLDVSTADAARASIETIKSAINMVSTNRANMGALQNRLEYTINNLDVAAENMTAANSRIRDTDMAKQMMEYTKTNVLTQAAQAMLAQANQQPQSILQLLQ